MSPKSTDVAKLQGTNLTHLLLARAYTPLAMRQFLLCNLSNGRTPSRVSHLTLSPWLQNKAIEMFSVLTGPLGYISLLGHSSWANLKPAGIHPKTLSIYSLGNSFPIVFKASHSLWLKICFHGCRIPRLLGSTHLSPLESQSSLPSLARLLVLSGLRLIT